MVEPFPSVVRVGGRQPDVGAFANMLAATGIVGPDGGPISEVCTFGIAGGIGELLPNDRGPVGLVIDRNTFDAARSAYKPGKHLLMSVASGQIADVEAHMLDLLGPR